MTLLQKLTSNLTLAIPVAMVSGFVLGAIADAQVLSGLILPLTFLMVYPMMVNLKIQQVFQGGDLKAQGLAQLINFAIIPFAAFGLGLVFFPNQPAMALGLLLAALLPTSGMTISWTGFAKGNMSAAIKMTVAGLILGSIATPFYVQWLMGASVPVDLFAVFREIALIVFLPMLAGYLTQRALKARFGPERFASDWAPRFPPLSTLGVLGIVFVAMALKAEDLLAQPQSLLWVIPPLLILYAANFLLSTVVGRWLLPRGDAIALVYGTVMRNLSIALALAMNAFGDASADAALVIAVAYVIQVQSAAWYVKLTDSVFGPSPSKS